VTRFQFFINTVSTGGWNSRTLSFLCTFSSTSLWSGTSVRKNIHLQFLLSYGYNKLNSFIIELSALGSFHTLCYRFTSESFQLIFFYCANLLARRLFSRLLYDLLPTNFFGMSSSILFLVIPLKWKERSTLVHSSFKWCIGTFDLYLYMFCIAKK